LALKFHRTEENWPGTRPKKEAAWGGLFQSSLSGVGHLSWFEMYRNFALRVEPIALTVAIMTTEMPAAIRPYSMAVAPDSSFRKLKIFDMERTPLHVSDAMVLPHGLRDVVTSSERMSGSAERTRLFAVGLYARLSGFYGADIPVTG
jgi:hypothetical protein